MHRFILHTRSVSALLPHTRSVSALLLHTCSVSALLLGLTACPSSDDGDTGVDTTGQPSSSSTAASEESSTSPTSSQGESSTAPVTTESGESESGDSTAADSSGSTGDGSSEGTTSAAGLEIVGEWADEFGGTHSITETSWVTTYGRDSFAYTIDSYDNDAHVVIAQSDDDESWTRYDWTETGEGELYFCQTAFGLDSAEEAEATPAADATDPGTSGCGGFAWSLLSPV